MWQSGNPSMPRGCYDGPMFPNPDHTARRNLVARIMRFLKQLETEGRQPSAYEARRVTLAMFDLERGDWAAGEAAMWDAERAGLATVAALAATDGASASSSELQRRLLEIRQGLES
jgi:hypothetical protein